MEETELKLKTARTLKWNTIDKFASQVFYGVTGVVLANLLSKEDFGLVGAMLVFQAFASLFVDSGFCAALIQKKSPTETDYCTVFYFNLGVSIAIYAILWACAPLIADTFGDQRLIGLSRVMFLSFIINATALVQTNRMMKQMTMARVAIANSLGLVVSGAAGIWLAVEGYGAWAIVWQTIILATVKSGFLWATTGWLPRSRFSMASLRSVFSVGSGVMVCSFLNTLSLNIYSFIIGAYYNLAKLGCYTQADKWSKMGIQSIAQILTASFLPVLSGFQDDRERLLRAMRKMNRFTAYLVFPLLLLLTTCAEPIFHILFGTKWDDAVVLFQILAVRGIFIVLATNINNYILGLGRSRSLVVYETVKDALMVIAIIVTIPLGITAMIWGQLAASALFYVYAVIVAGRVVGYPARHVVGDILPYAAISAVVAAVQWIVLASVDNPWLNILLQTAVCFALYYTINRFLNSTIQREVLGYALGRFRKKKDVKEEKKDVKEEIKEVKLETSPDQVYLFDKPEKPLENRPITEIPKGFKVIKFKRLPCVINTHQLIYIEPSYDARINSFIESNYDFVCKQLYLSETRFRPLVTFCYLPKLLDDLYKYHNPSLTETETEAAIAKGKAIDIKQFLTDESLASLTPSIILFGSCYIVNTDGTYSFLSLPLDVPDSGNLKPLFEACGHAVESVYSEWFKVHDIDFSAREGRPGINFADLCFDSESRRIIEEIQERINILQNKGVNTMFLHQMIDNAVPVSKLTITWNDRIFLSDYNNMEITMAALPKAVFFLFLRHPEGIRFKELVDYKKELLSIYSRLSPLGGIIMKEDRIDKVVDSTGNRINELCARIREAFVSKIDENIARNYFITGYRGEAKRIIINRDKVIWDKTIPPSRPITEKNMGNVRQINANDIVFKIKIDPDD